MKKMFVFMAVAVMAFTAACGLAESGRRLYGEDMFYAEVYAADSSLISFSLPLVTDRPINEISVLDILDPEGRSVFSQDGSAPETINAYNLKQLFFPNEAVRYNEWYWYRFVLKMRPVRAVEDIASFKLDIDGEELLYQVSHFHINRPDAENSGLSAKGFALGVEISSDGVLYPFNFKAGEDVIIRSVEMKGMTVKRLVINNTLCEKNEETDLLFGKNTIISMQIEPEVPEGEKRYPGNRSSVVVTYSYPGSDELHFIALSDIVIDSSNEEFITGMLADYVETVICSGN